MKNHTGAVQIRQTDQSNQQLNNTGETEPDDRSLSVNTRGRTVPNAVITGAEHGNLALATRLLGRLLRCRICPVPVCLRLVPFVQCAILFACDGCVVDCTPFKGLLGGNSVSVRRRRRLRLCRTRVRHSPLRVVCFSRRSGCHGPDGFFCDHQVSFFVHTNIPIVNNVAVSTRLSTSGVLHILCTPTAVRLRHFSSFHFLGPSYRQRTRMPVDYLPLSKTPVSDMLRSDSLSL